MLRVALISSVGGLMWWEQLLLFGGIFLLLLGLFALFSPLIRQWIDNRIQGKRADAGYKDKDESRITAIEYYPSRVALPKISKEFENTAVGYVLWYTGYGARGESIHLTGNIQRIILIHPDLNYKEPILSYLKNTVKYKPEDAELDIIRLSKESHEVGIDVRWLNEIPKVLIVVSNPNTPDGWIRVEEFSLTKSDMGWSSYRVYKAKDPLLFNSLCNSFELYWLKSKEPDWDKI